MATLKNTTVNDSGFLRLPVGTGPQRPPENADNLGAMRVNSSTGKLEYWSGSDWEINTVAFPFRTIITTAFMQGGYESSVAWNNCNKTFTATDTTVNLGDGAIDRTHNYNWGACSKDDAYVFGAAGHSTDSNRTIAFNMRTEQNTTDIERTLPRARWRFGGVFQEHFQTWFSGDGSSAIDKYNLVTKTVQSTISDTYRTGAIWGMSHEDYAVFYSTETASNFTFATETVSGRGGTAPSNHHQQKSINSKWNLAWCGNEGSYNGGNSFRRSNWTTNTTSGTVPKPVTNSGEENLTMGQDHQYMLGMYNGAQNNISWRWNYATESGFQGASSMEPKGKPGSSSGVCSWID